jgi:hypothetical protein
MKCPQSAVDEFYDFRRPPGEVSRPDVNGPTGKPGFEATALTVNTRAAALFEALLTTPSSSLTDIAQLPGEDLQIGTLLALLQDDAKHQSSYLTRGQNREQSEIRTALRRNFLVTEERADKLSGAWRRHPLMG